MTFDPQTTVTSAKEWRSDPRWRKMEQVDMSALRSLNELIVFAAHPDDETLGVGALLAAAGELSLPIQVVVATGSDQRRHDELEFALHKLGVRAHVDQLGFPDGKLKYHADDLSLAVSDIMCQSNGPAWAVAPWPGDRHGDHRTLGQEVAHARRPTNTKIFFYPVWLWQWGTVEECPWDQLREVPMPEPIRWRKQSALKQFDSQIRSSANPDGVLTADFLEHFREGPEVLIVPKQCEQEPRTGSLEGHFEKLHANSSDPWSVRTRWYEQRKRAVIMASLPRERFSQVLEIGCSIGEVSAELVHRCDHLIAIDGSKSAVSSARKRLHGSPTAIVQRVHVPDEWPDGNFDLIVLAEVAYYLTDEAWRRTIRKCMDSLAQDGLVLLCHWLGTAEDFTQTGTRVHETFRAESEMQAIVTHRDSEFLLEVFKRKSEAIE